MFLFLFFHWFGPLNAWEFFDIVDLLLAVIALGAVAIAGAKASGQDPFGGRSDTALAVAGLIAVSITGTFVLEGDHRRIGLWLSFLSSIGILYGGIRAMREPPGTPSPFARTADTAASPSEPTTPMTTAPDTPGVSGGGAAADETPPPPPADPVPGSTGAKTPPGLAGEPPEGEGTQPPGL